MYVKLSFRDWNPGSYIPPHMRSCLWSDRDSYLWSDHGAKSGRFLSTLKIYQSDIKSRKWGRSNSSLIGIKKTFVYYTSHDPKRINWVVHEYRANATRQVCFLEKQEFFFGGPRDSMKCNWMKLNSHVCNIFLHFINWKLTKGQFRQLSMFKEMFLHFLPIFCTYNMQRSLFV